MVEGTSITEHLQAKMHKNALLAKSQLGYMANYFRKLEPSKVEYDMAVYEGTYAYHTAPHNHTHSFCNMDCTSLQKKIYFSLKYIFMLETQ
jgi:hypothetical protein